MSTFDDLRSGLALRLTSNSVAQSSESKGLQAWTQQLTQTSKMGWYPFVAVRISLALMMLILLMWDNFVYFFGAQRLSAAIGGNGDLNLTLVPLCAYLSLGVVTTIWMSFGGRGHFKIAHPRMLTAHSLLATVAFPTSMLSFLLYWLIDFRNRTSSVPFLESESGERIVALGHSLGLFAALVDALVVEQALFLGDVFWVVLFGILSLAAMHIGETVGSGMGMMTDGGSEGQNPLWTESGRPSNLFVSEILAVFVALPLCYICFWLIARGREQPVLRNSKEKEVRQAMRQRDTLVAQPDTEETEGNPFEESSGP